MVISEVNRSPDPRRDLGDRKVAVDLHQDAASAVGDADRLLDEMMKTDDYREAVAAYAEKRAPRWSDS